MASPLEDQGAQAHRFFSALVPDASRIRMEIDEFVQDDAMTNLFLLALAEMQQEDPDKESKKHPEDWWTFYSLSGIHGLPKEWWHEVSGKNMNGGGYCTHGSIVFPTWHRVYILMFEKAVAQKMHDIAGRYSGVDKPKYQIAAGRFRLPFWDPVMPRNNLDKTKQDKKERVESAFGIPDILSRSEVYVVHWEENGPKTIPNPLESFTFPGDKVLEKKGRQVWTRGDGGQDAWKRKVRDKLDGKWVYEDRVPATGRKYTLRTPDDEGKTTYSGETGLKLKIQRQAQELSAKLWKLLSSYDWRPPQGKDPKDLPEYQRKWVQKDYDNARRDWMSFANHWVGGTPNEKGNNRYDASVSLESWHDDIHMLVGTGSSAGHMGDPSIAGFDPMFWLHHNNIDRLLAIYQALYPDQSDDINKPGDPTKWVPETGKVNATSPLLPFCKEEQKMTEAKKSEEKYWTSNNVKDWRTLGFAVPGDRTLTQSRRAELEKYLRENYYWATELDEPPPSVQKHLAANLERVKHCYALTGKEKSGGGAVITSVEALGDSKLVTRSLQLTAQTELQPVDIEREVVLVDAVNNKNLYPDGALRIEGSRRSMRTWSAQILVKKFAFNGSFNVHIFIGQINKDQPERFLTKKNEVGFAGIFASDSSAPCNNCLEQREEGFIYEDAVPLTMALTKYLRSYTDEYGPDRDMRTLENLEPEHVVPFLKKHIDWVITTTSSEVIDDVQRIKDSELQIAVWDRIFDLPSAEYKLGLYHPAELHQAITETQPGGLGYTYV